MTGSRDEKPSVDANGVAHPPASAPQAIQRRALPPLHIELPSYTHPRRRSSDAQPPTPESDTPHSLSSHSSSYLLTPHLVPADEDGRRVSLIEALAGSEDWVGNGEGRERERQRERDAEKDVKPSAEELAGWSDGKWKKVKGFEPNPEALGWDRWGLGPHGFGQVPPQHYTVFPVTHTHFNGWNGQGNRPASSNPESGPASNGEQAGDDATGPSEQQVQATADMLTPVLSQLHQPASNAEGLNPQLRFPDETIGAAAGENGEKDGDAVMEDQGGSSSTPSGQAAGSNSAGLLAPPGLEGLGEKKESGFSRSPELRVTHKLAERKRRKEMKELFDELRDELPADRGMKASKWEILSKAIDYLRQIKSQQVDMHREIEHLRREVDIARGGTGVHPVGYPTYNLPPQAYHPPAAGFSAQQTQQGSAPGSQQQPQAQQQQAQAQAPQQGQQGQQGQQQQQGSQIGVGIKPVQS
ncbi:hypothetical protein IAT38_004986 [Cryptococcus sp. DSM 104549]